MPPTKPRIVVVERPVPQSSALLALPGIPRDDPEWYAALVMNHVLGGGGQQSRLFNEVREKRGLAYSVSSGLRTYKRAALLVMSTGSANERVAEAIKVIRAEMGRMRNEGITEAELDRCQDLPDRRAGPVARFVGLDRGPAALHADRRPVARSPDAARGA